MFNLARLTSTPQADPGICRAWWARAKALCDRLRGAVFASNQQEALAGAAEEAPSTPAASVSGHRPGAAPALTLLFLVCAQAALLQPYLVLLPGERTNLFTPLLALLPLIPLWRQCRSAWGRRHWAVWLLLGVGLAGCARLSAEPASSLARVFAFWAPASSGLFCGAVLLGQADSRRLFFRCLTTCFAAVTAMHFVLASPPKFLGWHHHALTGVLLLLSAGPLHWLLSASGWGRIAPAALLAAGYALCFQAGSRFAVLLPILIFCGLAISGRAGWLRSLALAALVAALALCFFAANPGKLLRFDNYESTSYRLEGVSAAFDLMRQHPLAGIGIRTSRVELLQDFVPSFGTADRDFFLGVLARNVTLDNQYLSLPVGVGIPLAVLYFFLVGRLFLRFGRAAAAHRLDSATDMALLVPLAGTVLHLAIYDGLFYPQVGWFFHLLLGLAASLSPGDTPQARGPIRDR